MKKRKILSWLLCGIMIMGLLTGCGSTTANETSGTAGNEPPQDPGSMQTTSEHVTTTEGIDVELTGDYSDKALDASYDEASAEKITLTDSVTITEKGTYIISGTLEDGQLIVDLKTDDNVQLVLAGASISCSTGAPIVIMNAKNTYLTLADGTDNYVTDVSEYVKPENEEEENINAAIYSKDDLIINGSGSLHVEAKSNDGITSKDDLQIIDGTIVVNAVDDGIVGKDSISVRDGSIEVTAGGDAIKSSNQSATDKGYVVIDGGDFTLSAGDDGIHAETALVINDGNINVTKSVEGLEGLDIVINDGTVNVTASDDGVNVSGGVDTNSEDSANGMGFGRGGMGQAIDGALVINGGSITVDAEGDGLDSNGGILITGGTTYVYGPTNDGNGALDYNGSMEVTGGILVAAGSSGMAQAPSDISSQESVGVTFDSYLEGGIKVTIKAEDGSEILSVTPAKKFNNLVVSTPDIKTDEAYTFDADGNSVTAVAGELDSFTGMGGMGGHGGGPGGMRPEDGSVSGNHMRPEDGSVSGNRMRPDKNGISGNEMPPGKPNDKTV